MKVKAKCCVDQVLKYALLGLAVELSEGKAKEHYLILLAKGPFSRLFEERFESVDKLADAIGTCDLASFLQKKPKRFRDNRERLSQIAKEMHVELLNYEYLDLLLRDASPPLIDQSPGAEVYRKLISGLRHELKCRELF